MGTRDAGLEGEAQVGTGRSAQEHAERGAPEREQPCPQSGETGPENQLPRIGEEAVVRERGRLHPVQNAECDHGEDRRGGAQLPPREAARQEADQEARQQEAQRLGAEREREYRVGREQAARGEQVPYRELGRERGHEQPERDQGGPHPEPLHVASTLRTSPAGSASPSAGSGRSSGKRTTSRMEGELVKSIASRSMPIPSPAVGGMPCSSART